MWSIYLQLSVALALGIYFGDKISVGDTLIFTLALILTTGFGKLVLKKRFSVSTMAILMCVFGIVLYHYSVSESNRAAYPFQDKYVTMLGKITDLPKTEEDYNVYLVDVRLMNYLGQNKEVHERVKVATKETFQFGDSVKVSGFLQPFPKKLNGGDYDVGRNYKAKGIYFKTYSDEMELTDIHFKTYSPAYFVTWIKSKISDRIYERYEGDEAAVLRAIIIGYRDSFSEEFEDLLYESNTMRLFYPAYMHISFILMLVGLLSEYVKKKNRDKILIILLALYGIYNFNSHYIVKSALVIAVIAYSKYKIGFGNYMDILAVIVGIILITNPLIGYEIGFVISVTANILIFYFTPLISAKLKKVRNHKLKRILSLWIVLAIGMLPMEAYYFSMTTPYAFLLNLIYMPLLGVLWMIMPAQIALINTGVAQYLSYTIGGINYFIMTLPKMVSKLPFYSIPLPRPNILIIAVFYIGLYLFRQILIGKKKDDYSVQMSSAIIVGFLLTSVFGYTLKMNDVKVDFVNVGQGDGAVISVPFHETILIDGGGNSEYTDYNYGKKVFVPYLRRAGYHNIDFAVISHYHSDHCLGVIEAMKKLKVKEVLMPDCMEGNEYRAEIEQIAKEKNIKISHYQPGTKLNFKSGVEMDIITPDEEDLQSSDENDTSIGLRLRYGEFSALFTGDITSNIEEKHEDEWGECNVLKVAHHGSGASSGEAFIDEVSPDVAVISVGLDNAFSLPNNSTLQRFMKRNIPVYRTDLNGNISVYADKDGSFRLNTFLDD